MQNNNLKNHDDLIFQKLNEVIPDSNLLKTSFSSFLLERKEKKKRQFLIWFFSFLLFLSGGGIVYYFSNQNLSNNANKVNKTINIIPSIDTGYANPNSKDNTLNILSENSNSKPDSSNLNMFEHDLLKETEVENKKLENNKNTPIYNISNKNNEAFTNKLDTLDTENKNKMKPIMVDSIAKKGTKVISDTFYIVW